MTTKKLSNAVITTPPHQDKPGTQPTMRPHKRRVFDYDFIRFIAICFVLSVHASWMTYHAYTPLQAAYADTMRSIFLTCNGLFFLLAGKFALTKHAYENINTFYAKKFSALIIPLLIIGFIRTLYHMYPQYETLPHVLKTYVVNLASAFFNSEFWFMFVLIPLIFAAPFLAPAFEKLHRTKLNWFFVLVLVWLTMHFVAVNKALPFAWTWIFPGINVSYFFLFCIGATFEEYFESKRAKSVLIACGCLAFIACILCHYLGFVKQLDDNSPLYIALTLSMFFLLKRLSKLCKYIQKPISFVAPYVFYIYLLHMPFQYTIRYFFPAITEPNSIVIFIPLVIASFIGSFVLGIVIDKLLVKPCQTLFLSLCRGRKRA